MTSHFKGFTRIFSFTFFQHLKSKGYRTTTLAIALLCLLVPMAVFVGIEVFGGSDESADYEAQPIDMTVIERVLIVDDTEGKLADMSALSMFMSQSGLNVEVKNYGDDFDGAREAAGDDKNALILYTQQEGELYTTNIIVAEDSHITEDMAYNFQIQVDSYLYALEMAYNGYVPEDEPEEVLPSDEEEYMEAEDDSVNELVIMIVSYLNIMILYFFVLAYGQSVANSVVMEKSSKLMETFLISVKPTAMILGKLLAITLTGILQFVSWIVAIVLGICGGIGLVNIINPKADIAVLDILEMIRELTADMFTFGNCLLALLMVMVGLLLYCALAGIGGALASKSEDLASSNVIFTMVLVISFLVAIYAGGLSGDVNAAPWLDWIPFTAVMVTPAKVLLGAIPLWKSVASLAVIAVTTLAATAIAGKVYKTMVLYKGEVPKPQNIIKMLMGK